MSGIITVDDVSSFVLGNRIKVLIGLLFIMLVSVLVYLWIPKTFKYTAHITINEEVNSINYRHYALALEVLGVSSYKNAQEAVSRNMLTSYVKKMVESNAIVQNLQSKNRVFIKNLSVDYNQNEDLLSVKFHSHEPIDFSSYISSMIFDVNVNWSDRLKEKMTFLTKVEIKKYQEQREKLVAYTSNMLNSKINLAKYGLVIDNNNDIGVIDKESAEKMIENLKALSDLGALDYRIYNIDNDIKRLQGYLVKLENFDVARNENNGFTIDIQEEKIKLLHIFALFVLLYAIFVMLVSAIFASKSNKNC